jgi:hypothetical protein
MPAKASNTDESLTNKQIADRRDAALRRALKTPPSKHETKGKPKDKKSQSSDRRR